MKWKVFHTVEKRDSKGYLSKNLWHIFWSGWSSLQKIWSEILEGECGPSQWISPFWGHSLFWKNCHFLIGFLSDCNVNVLKRYQLNMFKYVQLCQLNKIIGLNLDFPEVCFNAELKIGQLAFRTTYFLRLRLLLIIRTFLRFSDRSLSLLMSFSSLRFA